MSNHHHTAPSQRRKARPAGSPNQKQQQLLTNTALVPATALLKHWRVHAAAGDSVVTTNVTGEALCNRSSYQDKALG